MMPGLDNDLSELMSSFKNDVNQGKYLDSYTLVQHTVNLLRKLIAHSKWNSAGELISLLKEQGKELVNSAPSENSIGNMVRRILKIIRDENASPHNGNHHQEDELEESLHKLVLIEGEDCKHDITSVNLKAAIMENLGELLMEFETSVDNIAAKALEHIHSNEIIMTIGRSRTVETFLKHAAKHRTFQVIVAECAPFYNGQDMALSLAKAKIQTTLIPDSSIFAMMARVNKVIMGTHSVMANGGLKAVCGSHTVALAAKHHSVPLIVCAPMYKFSPQYVCSLDQDGFNSFASPINLIRGSEGGVLSSVQIYNPVFDYVPPELVKLFISNTKISNGFLKTVFTSGGHAPSYIYRLLSELYHPLDSEL